MYIYSDHLEPVPSEQLQNFFGRDREATLLWMECGSCNGESMAILGAEGLGKTGDNPTDFLEDEQVRLLWHPSLSEIAPKKAGHRFDGTRMRDLGLTDQGLE